MAAFLSLIIFPFLVICLIRPVILSRFVTAPTRKKVLLVIGIPWLLATVIGLSSPSEVKVVDDKKNLESSKVEQYAEQIEKFEDNIEEAGQIDVELEAQTIITSEEELIQSISRGEVVVDKQFNLDLFLDQRPTSTDGYFTTTPIDESVDGFQVPLILCYMSSEELLQLDAEAASNKLFPKYAISGTFTDFHTELVILKANCKLD